MTNILFKIGAWCLARLFKFVDIYCPKNVEGITFTNDKRFLNYVSKYGVKK